MHRGNGRHETEHTTTTVFSICGVPCEFCSPSCHFNVSDYKGVHSRHGLRHLDCLPHSEQQSPLCLLRNSPATVSAQSGTHSQRSDLHSHQPARCNEGPEGRFLSLTCFFGFMCPVSCQIRVRLCEFVCFKTGGPAGVEGADCSLPGQAAAGP